MLSSPAWPPRPRRPENACAIDPAGGPFWKADSTANQADGSLYYLVKVEVDGADVGLGEYTGPIKLGLAGQAEIITGQDSLLALLVKKMRRTISLG
jgi:hypothetical protein